MAVSSTPLLVQVGKRLRTLREVAGLTQEQVAERAGFTGKDVSEIERGLRDVPLSTLERVATRALETKVESLFGARASEVWENPALPRSVEVLARRLAALPDLKRRAVLRILREILGVVGG
ncbi:MAG: helix-turn-helix transcriptional regulator [Deltaproteobacteria bacterium]|nr:helix-turn-helix transcriptional regulator [Deltaproteobacteria bacterium]